MSISISMPPEWGVLSQNCKRPEENYDMILSFVIYLRNILIKHHPLREMEGAFYEKYTTRLFDMRKGNLEKHRAI